MFIKPRHTWESTVRLLAEGLANGSIVLDEEPAAEDPAEPEANGALPPDGALLAGLDPNGPRARPRPEEGQRRGLMG